MREILLTIILGIVQGLTEFLPVSSSGHLTLLQDIFGFSQENSLFLTVALHLGTLGAVVVYYFKDLLGLFKKENHKIILWLVLATIPAGITMIFLKDLVASSVINNYLCFGFLLTAILLLVAEYVGKKITAPKDLTWKTALIMGCAQSVAIFPAISRSGSTITAGVVSGVERNQVAKFSFFMSIPIILGSAVFECFDANWGEINIVATLCGVVAAFISGYLAIKFMLKLIGKCNFKWFSLYLFLLSIITFLDSFIVNIW